MHIAGRSYQEVCATFRWDIPQRFNIARAICDRHADTAPTATALIHEAIDGRVETWSFARIREAANRLANGFAALGLVAGDRVAINLPQGPEILIAHVAAQKAALVVLPLFNLFGSDAIAFRLRDSGARLLVTSEANHARVEQELDRIPTLDVVLVVGSVATARKMRGFWPTVEAGASSFATLDTGPDDPALLMYTSGTTGNPKGVLHAARVLLGHLPGVILPHGFFPQPGDRFWTPADWAWAGGLLDVLLPSLFHGVPVVATARAKFDPEWAFASLARHGVRNAFIPPTALRLMRQVASPRERYDTRLRSLGTGGERLGAEMMAWGREALGVDPAEFFGQTEVNLVVGNSPGLFPVRDGAMGRAIPGHEVEIVDDRGEVQPAGTPGVVAVRRPDPVMFLEYWKQPEATAAKFRGDWCLLGDVAVKDADGYFWYQGRDDDIIKSSGYRIGPGEVEECLMKHPAVAAAGVVGVPDALRGEMVAAFVVPKPGFAATPELAGEIQAFVKSQLAAHEYPRRLQFIDSLPMTVTGKVRRVELRKLLQADAPAPPKR